MKTRDTVQEVAGEGRPERFRRELALHGVNLPGHKKKPRPGRPERFRRELALYGVNMPKSYAKPKTHESISRKTNWYPNVNRRQDPNTATQWTLDYMGGRARVFVVSPETSARSDLPNVMAQHGNESRWGIWLQDEGELDEHYGTAEAAMEAAEAHVVEYHRSVIRSIGHEP